MIKNDSPFGEQVLDAISKISKRNTPPDLEIIFKHISSNSASNICMNDVKEKLQELIDISKIEKRTANQGFDSYFIINGETVLIAENQGIFGTQDSFHSTGPNITVGDSVETPKIRNKNIPNLNEIDFEDFTKDFEDFEHVEDFTARFVEMKVFFMNESFGFKMEIKSLQEKLQNRRNISPNTNDNIKNLELQISFLKQENLFTKTDL